MLCQGEERLGQTSLSKLRRMFTPLTATTRIRGISACLSSGSRTSHAGIAAYALPGRRTLRADEPVEAEAYVYPTDGYNPNSWHLCLSQQWVSHRARFKLNVLQSDSSNRLLSAA